MSVTPNMGLYAWDQGSDPYDHTQLANNFYAIDGHDHTEGRGLPIGTEALVDQAVTAAKIRVGGVTTPTIADLNVTTGKLANGAVTFEKLANGAVAGDKIADFAVTSRKLDKDVRPIGEIIAWWRPNTAEPVPTGYEIADGRVLGPADHDFAGGGNITLPNLTNRFLLGASIGTVGVTPETPPAVGQVGGSHRASLAHSHTVNAHSHTVDAHTHTVNGHTHTVAHRHTVEPHNHTVNAHDHVVPGHTHPVPGHTHTIDHTHGVNSHSHTIAGAGEHNHRLNQRETYSAEAANQYLSRDGSGNQIWRNFVTRQTAYSEDVYNVLPGFIPGVSAHNHGGSTGRDEPGTGGPSNGNSGSTSLNTDANGNFLTQTSSPQTNNASPFTTTETPTTSSTPLTTNAASPGTSNASPGTSTELTNPDVRPGFVGVLFLIKVKN